MSASLPLRRRQLRRDTSRRARCCEVRRRQALLTCRQWASASSLRGLRRFVVDMNFQQKAPVLGFERTMQSARRTACIGVGRKAFASITLFIVADGQVAGDEVHLFLVIV